MSFGAADFVELGLAAFLALLVWISREWVEPRVRRVAGKARWVMAALVVLPILLRLVLMGHHPVPTARTYQEFANLLGADTLLHLRMANPPLALAPFFETPGVLQAPSYSAVAGLAPSALAMFGWAGVLLSTGAFCALCYWMLLGWTSPLWALIGGMLAVIEFGPLNAWMNGYAGGALGAAAGCVVFGALARLRLRYRTRDAVLLGSGLALMLLISPYQYALLLACVILFFVRPTSGLIEAVPVVIAAILPAFGLMLLQNHAVTGGWMVSPATLSQQQYGVPDSLTVQATPQPDRELTPQQQLLYRAQLSYRERDGESLRSFLLRLEYRVRFYRFFFLPALYLALPFFLFSIRRFDEVWIVLALSIFSVGINFIAEFELTNLAAVTGLFVLMSVLGLERMSRMNREASWMVLALCAAHFVLWYGLHLSDSSEMLRYETWDGINHMDRRSSVEETLAGAAGKQLVIVRYAARHPYLDEWVHNEADLDAAKVVWARDRGREENEKLLAAFPGRTVLLLEPDASPATLTQYAASENDK